MTSKEIVRNTIIVLILCVIFGSVYAVGQQVLRQSANDPQIEIAESLAQDLNAQGNTLLPALNSSRPIDIRTSLSPFFIVFDSAGTPLTNLAFLDGTAPKLPQRVLDYVQKNGQNRITWQPARNVRIAAVIDKTNNGFVLAGRSLREVEDREDQLMLIVSLGFLASLMLLGALFLLGKRNGH